MLGRYRGRLTSAHVMAAIALFIALGGGAYAAVSLPKNSVGTKQLKKGAVTNAKLGKNSVTGVKVKDGSLSGADLNVATLGKVPAAASADNTAHANNADNAGHSNNSDNATHADAASHATNADHASNADTAATATSLSTLASGQTDVGQLYLIAPKNSGSAFIGQQISFPNPLASTPTGEFVVPPGTASTVHCPGTADNPKAAPGYLCVYLTTRTGSTNFFDVRTRFGAGISMPVTGGAGYDYEVGTWAVTAP